jgi:hypothetical protein
MKVAIMQPYLFPYLGYFQLIDAVDVFVIHDDVQYIKKGWINRNKILCENSDVLFTFSINKDSSSKLINQRFYSDANFKTIQDNFMKTIFYTYKKSPHFSEIYNLLSEIFDYNNFNVAEFNSNSIKKLCDFIGIGTKFIFSSSLEKNNELKAQERVIEINRVLASDCYINPIGGIELYSRNAFREYEITLKFIQMNQIKYPQFGSEFVPSLSIIDVLMFNSKNKIKELLNEYELI